MRSRLLLTCAMIAFLPAAAAQAQTSDPRPAPAAGIDVSPATTVAPLPVTSVTGTAAQTQTASQTLAASSDQPERGLAEIVVTAQRRSESSQRAAVPVAVVSPAQLARAGLTQPSQLGTLVPALSVQPNGGANTIFFLRGVGNFTVNGYSDPAIAFNYDGIYVGRPTGTFGYFFDLERIEVLKGPQGTVYGRNATGGVINVLPAKPILGQFSGYLSGTFGNYNAFTAEGAINAPLGSETALRISGSARGHKGYLSDGTSDDRGQSVRAQLLTEAFPSVTVRIAADYSHAGGRGVGASYPGRPSLNAARTSYDFVPSGLPTSTGLLDPTAQAFRTTQLYSATNGRFDGPLTGIYLDNQFYGANAQIDWKTDAGTLTIVPGQRWQDLDNIYIATGANQYVQEHDKQLSLEARWTGKRLWIFDYLVGAYYFKERVAGNYTFNQQVFNNYQDFTSKTRSYAGFGRITANLTPQLRLVGATRYTVDHKNFNGVADVITVICRNPATPAPACPNAPILPLTDTPDQLPFAIPARGAAPISLVGTGAVLARGSVIINQPLKSSRPTYRAAVEFDVAPHSLAYASYESGYRSGGFALAVGHETFQPEYIDAYTLGLKNRFFDNKLQLNLELFYWKYRNQQISHAGIDFNGVNGVFTDNAGSSTNKGVEADGQFLLTPNTLLSVDVQYLKARFKSFVYAVPRGAAPPVTYCSYGANPGNAAQYLIDCSGNPSYQSPKWAVNMGAQQTIPLGEYKLVAAVDTQYRTSRYVGFDYAPWEFVRPSWVTNLNVSFAPVSERYSVGLYIRNLENDRIVTSAYLQTAGNGGLQVTSPPRTYGMQASVKF